LNYAATRRTARCSPAALPPRDQFLLAQRPGQRIIIHIRQYLTIFQQCEYQPGAADSGINKPSGTLPYKSA
jgi:hypothetical protein